MIAILTISANLAIIISRYPANLDIIISKSDDLMENFDRIFTPPKQSYFLFGPRGTGKTTWLHLHYDKCVVIDLLKPDIYRLYSASPELLRETVYAYPENTTFIIDEVQKIPELLDLVHELIETKKGWHFVLTGSSARKLKKSGTNLLAGRALLRHMHPFMACELGAKFNLPQALKYGMLPIIQSNQDHQQILDAYIGIYLKEEVLQEGIIRNIGNFSRFLEAMSFSQASTLNLSNIARDTSTNRRVVENYISILEDLLLAYKLPAFTKRAKRVLSSTSKFYFFDCGVYRSLRPKGPLDHVDEIDGITLETLIAQHLKAWCDYSTTDQQMYFWRTKHGVEVDFIIYGEKHFYAIEVKNTHTIRPADTKALKSFCNDYPEATPILLYRGDLRILKDKIMCIPVDEFLNNIYPDKPIGPTSS